MKHKIVAILFFALCASAARAQLTSDSLLVDGHHRSFHFVKGGDNQSGASIVFVLHGSGGTGLGARKAAMSLEKSASKENVLLVYPDGYKRYWNECRKAATSLANKENIDENAFFAGMISYFQKKYQADIGKVFVVGTSGGGHMAYKLAMTMPEKITAITAIIANLPTESNMDCAPVGKPLPVMIINGTKDPLNKYEGGEMSTGGVYLGTVRSTDETLRYWSHLAGYQGTPKMTGLPDTDPSDGKTIEKYVFSEGKKPEIVLLKVINGKHDYPGDIDVHLEAWAFFKRQDQK